MNKLNKKINRRDFFKTIGVAGLASGLASDKTFAESKESEKPAQIPKRKLGKTGIEVPALSLGTNALDNQLVLRSAFKWGVNYFDTANSYLGGQSELNIGKFLSISPELRKDLFIATKASMAKIVDDVEQRLRTSLKRLGTNYIDLYYFHGISDPAQLTTQLKGWAQNAKKSGRIRFFGFSTHKNMADNLNAAAKLDWIDTIMTSCNFRLMQNKEFISAIDACYKSGTGLVAMKTVGLTFRERKEVRAGKNITTENDKKFISYWTEKGFTDEQARIKFVLQDKRIASACVGMKTIGTLTANIASVLDKTKLTEADKKTFSDYAQADCSGYCAGCANICDTVLGQKSYVSDILRYLMYYNSYGEKKMATQLFAALPPAARANLTKTDYRPAERACPQNLPIAKVIAEAVSKLA